LAEALNAARMNQVAEFFGEPSFRRGVRFDDSEMSLHLYEVMEAPLLGIGG